MSIGVNLEPTGLLVVRLSGTVTAPEFQTALQQAATLLKPKVSAGVVAVLQGFEGWGSGDWGANAIGFTHDAQIKRMAIVGDPKWEDPAMLFVGKGLRHFDIQYFGTAQLDQARRWAATGAQGQQPD